MPMKRIHRDWIYLIAPLGCISVYFDIVAVADQHHLFPAAAANLRWYWNDECEDDTQRLTDPGSCMTKLPVPFPHRTEVLPFGLAEYFASIPNYYGGTREERGFPPFPTEGFCQKYNNGTGCAWNELCMESAHFIGGVGQKEHYHYYDLYWIPVVGWLILRVPSLHWWVLPWSARSNFNSLVPSCFKNIRFLCSIPALLAIAVLAKQVELNMAWWILKHRLIGYFVDLSDPDVRWSYRHHMYVCFAAECGNILLFLIVFAGMIVLWGRKWSPCGNDMSIKFAYTVVFGVNGNFAILQHVSSMMEVLFNMFKLEIAQNSGPFEPVLMLLFCSTLSAVIFPFIRRYFGEEMIKGLEIPRPKGVMLSNQQSGVQPSITLEDPTPYEAPEE
jgi:hypothetical protein